MDQQTQIELARRVLAHVRARTTDHDDAGAITRDASAYFDPSREEREREALFRGCPVALVHSSRVAGPGAYVTHDETGLPLLLVRGDDGRVRAFLNVCRHRGTRLVDAPCGKRKAFSCPYHAWTYDKTGALVGVPHEEGFGAVDRAERSLVKIEVRESAGFVWLLPRAGAGTAGASDVDAFVGETIARDLRGFGVSSAHVYDPRTIDKELDWKLAIDVFLEAYHLKSAHRDTIYAMFFDNLGLVDRLGPHLRNVFPKRTIRELASVPESEWRLRAHANVLYHLFPNTLVLVQPDHAGVLHVWPRGPGRTRLSTYTLVPEPPATDKARAYWDANNGILYGAIEEDLSLGESIQRGLRSGANRSFVFGAFEHALVHFHSEIDRRLVARTSGTHADHGGTIT